MNQIVCAILSAVLGYTSADFTFPEAFIKHAFSIDHAERSPGYNDDGPRGLVGVDSWMTARKRPVDFIEEAYDNAERKNAPNVRDVKRVQENTESPMESVGPFSEEKSNYDVKLSNPIENPVMSDMKRDPMAPASGNADSAVTDESRTTNMPKAPSPEMNPVTQSEMNVVVYPSYKPSMHPIYEKPPPYVRYKDGFYLETPSEVPGGGFSGGNPGMVWNQGSGQMSVPLVYPSLRQGYDANMNGMQRGQIIYSSGNGVGWNQMPGNVNVPIGRAGVPGMNEMDRDQIVYPGVRNQVIGNMFIPVGRSGTPYGVLPGSGVMHNEGDGYFANRDASQIQSYGIDPFVAHDAVIKAQMRFDAMNHLGLATQTEKPSPKTDSKVSYQNYMKIMGIESLKKDPITGSYINFGLQAPLNLNALRPNHPQVNTKPPTYPILEYYQRGPPTNMNNHKKSLRMDQEEDEMIKKTDAMLEPQPVIPNPSLEPSLQQMSKPHGMIRMPKADGTLDGIQPVAAHQPAMLNPGPNPYQNMPNPRIMVRAPNGYGTLDEIPAMGKPQLLPNFGPNPYQTKLEEMKRTLNLDGNLDRTRVRGITVSTNKTNWKIVSAAPKRPVNMTTVDRPRTTQGNRTSQVKDTAVTKSNETEAEKILKSAPKWDDFGIPIKWVHSYAKETEGGLARVTDPKTSKNYVLKVNNETLVPVAFHGATSKPLLDIYEEEEFDSYEEYKMSRHKE